MKAGEEKFTYTDHVLPIIQATEQRVEVTCSKCGNKTKWGEWGVYSTGKEILITCPQCGQLLHKDIYTQHHQKTAA